MLMKCGHAAQSNSNGQPCCVICIGINEGATIPAELPNLVGRRAKCSCGKEVYSSLELPFFQHRPTYATDLYYCGCWGWD